MSIMGTPILIEVHADGNGVLGMPAAQYLTGLCLLQGRGVSADRRAAAVWLRKAAQNGSREAGQLLMQFGL